MFYLAARAANAPFLGIGAMIVVFALLVTQWVRASYNGYEVITRFNAGEKAFKRAALVLAGVFFVVYCYLSVHRYYKEMLGAWDLGIFESVLDNALAGRFFRDYRGAFDHLDVGLALFLPFWALWRDARVLLVLQTAALTLAAWPLYLLAKEVSGRVVIGAVVVIVYLLYPLLGAGNLYDFHAVSLSPLLFFSMLLFMRRRRWGWYWVFVALVLLVKETEAILVFGAGLYLVSQREYKVGAVTAAAAVGWLLAATLVVLPWMTGEPYRHFARYGGILESAQLALGTAKGREATSLYAARAAGVLFSSLVPAGFLFARRWRPFLLIFGPVFVIYVFSKDAFQQVFFGHYGITATAAALGAAALATEGIRGLSRDDEPSILPAFVVITALLSNVILSFPAGERWASPTARLDIEKSWNVLSMPIPATKTRRKFYGISRHERFFLDVKGLFPRGSAIAAQNNLGYFFASGYALRDLSADVEADFYIFDFHKNYGFTSEKVYRALLAQLGHDGKTVRFFDLSTAQRGDFVFFAKGDKWVQFYSNAKKAFDRDHSRLFCGLAAYKIEKAMGLPRTIPPLETLEAHPGGS